MHFVRMAHTFASRDHLVEPGGPAALAVSVERALDPLADDYAELFAASEAGAFEHPLWLGAFYRRLAPARDASPVVVTGRDARGALQFVLPLILRRVSGIVLLESHDLGVSDYAAPVVRRGFVPPENLRSRIASVLPRHDILRIRPVREGDVPQWAAFFDAAARKLDFCAHATALAPSYEAWRAGAYSDSFARYLERKKKRFRKAPGASVRLLTEPEDIAAAIGSIQKGRAGRFEGDLIQDDRVRDFYADVAANGAPQGLARTYAIALDGEDIGHAFGLTHAGRFHYLLIACDYERHGKHSPGLILYDAMIADWIAAGGDVFDFTIGDEPFKADFGTRPTAIYELRASASLRGRIAQAAFDARERLRRARTASGGTDGANKDGGGSDAS